MPLQGPDQRSEIARQCQGGTVERSKILAELVSDAARLCGKGVFAPRPGVRSLSQRQEGLEPRLEVVSKPSRKTAEGALAILRAQLLVGEQRNGRRQVRAAGSELAQDCSVPPKLAVLTQRDLSVSRASKALGARVKLSLERPRRDGT